MKRQLLSLMVLLALLVGLLGTAPVPVHATGFEVTVNFDDAWAHDAAPGNGICADAWGLCTLRAAIEEANALPGADVITFFEGMSIPLDITVGELPFITDRLRIDASAVWNAAGNRPGVTLTGVNMTLNGLSLHANNCEVYGLYLINFVNAIDIRSGHNSVGGPLPGQRNVIASNSNDGVLIYGFAAHHNVVWGNWIGLSITGDTKQGNLDGVYIAGGAYQNTIGGDMVGEQNVISGNTDSGVEIRDAGSDYNLVGGNLIGLPAVGSLNVGNGGIGVYVRLGPQGTQIGGFGQPLGITGNVIAMNCNAGVVIWDADNNWVQNNTIAGNGASGVAVADGATNGIASNEIAYNTQHGVRVEGATATGNLIVVNSIHHNGGKGIDLRNGGNLELPAPVITTANASGASGTGCAGCTILLYSDSADEGEIYHGTVNADGLGHWSYSGSLSGPNVTATNFDAGTNTSEFSVPFTIGGGQYRVFVPFVRNH